VHHGGTEDTEKIPAFLRDLSASLLPSGSKYEAFDAALEDRNIEVDEQSNPVAPPASNKSAVGLVNGQKPFDRLESQNYLLIDNHIHVIPAVQADALVDNWERCLPMKRDLSQLQFMAEASLVCRFEQSGAKMAMHIDGRSNNPARKLLVY
jgi:hypothetical protein